jgi:hypothetical protein
MVPEAPSGVLPPRYAHAMPAPAVRVVEVTAERSLEELPEIPHHLLRPAGPGSTAEVSVQLRTTLRRVAMGAGLARRPQLVESVRALPGVPAVVTSPAGGTFGGPAWLGLAAIGVPPPPPAPPIDWMLHALEGWLGGALAPLGIAVTTGRVDGAWCPGFSDIAAGGRKLAGLGFRVTRDWVAMRGVLAVGAIGAADLEVLQEVHRLIGVEVRGDACTSLEQLTGTAWSVEEAIRLLSAGATASAPAAAQAG